ncbi:MAG: NAD-dependent epimerase/dehydratase family protein [Actinomycetota bacterium]
MRVAIIGGAGFLGSHLVDQLLAAGRSVDVIDDLSSGALANLADARRSDGALKIDHLDAAGADLHTLLGMRTPDVVFHLALLPRHDRSGPAQLGALDRTLVLLEAARRHRIGKVVVALPARSLYGYPAPSALPVKETEPLPRGVRGVVARAILDLLTEYRERHAIEFTALAMTTVYGPRQRPTGGLVASLAAAAAAGETPALHADGRQTRDLLFVDDAADALSRAAERGSGLLINVGTGHQTLVRDVWARMAGPGAASPTTVATAPDDLIRFAVSPVRARIHLQWSPWTDVDTGLSQL